MQTAVFCHSCGTEVAGSSSFCYSCGVRLTPALSEAGTRAAPWTVTDILKAIGIVVLVLVATSIPASILALIIAGDAEIEQDATALTVALAAGTLLELALVGTAVHFSVRKYRLSWSALGLKRPGRGGFWGTLGLAVALLVGGLAINFCYFLALDAVGANPKTEVEEAFQNAGPFIVLVILSLLFAPLMEELFFRGFVFGGLRSRWGVPQAAVASGLLFALAHIGNPGTIYLMPPVAAIGALFAWGYWYSGSLLAGLLAHFLFNLLALGSGIAQYS